MISAQNPAFPRVSYCISGIILVVLFRILVSYISGIMILMAGIASKSHLLHVQCVRGSFNGESHGERRNLRPLANYKLPVWVQGIAIYYTDIKQNFP